MRKRIDNGAQVEAVADSWRSVVLSTPAHPASVLILARDRAEGEVLVALLATFGFSVHSAALGWDGIVLMERTGPDVLLLDAGASTADGLEVCRQLRQITSVPIMLLCLAPDKDDVIHALTAGADDCIPKTCDPDLLRARLQALVRRHRLDRDPDGRVLRIRDLTLDPDRHEVTLRGERLALTPMEFRLLSGLVLRAGRVVPSRYLLEMAQGYRCSEQEAQEIIKVHVRNLRSKLVPLPDEPPYILNVRGVGYMLERRGGLSPASSDVPDGPVDEQSERRGPQSPKPATPHPSVHLKPSRVGRRRIR